MLCSNYSVSVALISTQHAYLTENKKCKKRKKKSANMYDKVFQL